MASQLETLGPLARYEVKGLFGGRSFSFKLAVDAPTLLTGSNGTGKSTILRSIDAISTGRWYDLQRMPFDAVILTFAKHKLSVRRRGDELVLTLDDQKCTFDPRVFERIRRRRPSESALLSRDRATLMREARARGMSDSQLRFIVNEEELGDLVQPWVSEIPLRLPVLFVTDQRLIVAPADSRRAKAHPRARQEMPESEEVGVAVQQYAENLHEQIRSQLWDYSRRSQFLDSSFPKKAVESMSRKKQVSKEDLSSLRLDVEKKRSALAEVGLLEGVEPPQFDESLLDREHIRTVIHAFEQDMLEKYSALDDFQNRLRVFLAFLNEHYEGKRVVVDPRVGFTLQLETGETLDPAGLSSGEQQMLVLAYQVLFLAEPDTLVLIDEPEISLHVMWQDRLVEHLAAMGSTRHLRFILATHSPALIGAREELKRSLDR